MYVDERDKPFYCINQMKNSTENAHYMAGDMSLTLIKDNGKVQVMRLSIIIHI